MAKVPKIKISRIRYFPIVQNWRKLKPWFESGVATTIWSLNMRDFAEQRAAQHKFKFKYDASRYESPARYDGCDWRCGRRGRHPQFWNYVCHSACHWVVDLCLYVAQNACPKVPWRIITSRDHSTVWNGSTTDPVLFDINFLALDVSARQAWKIVSTGRQLKPGKILRPYVFGKGYFKKAA